MRLHRSLSGHSPASPVHRQGRGFSQLSAAAVVDDKGFLVREQRDARGGLLTCKRILLNQVALVKALNGRASSFAKNLVIEQEGLKQESALMHGFHLHDCKLDDAINAA